MCSLRAPGGGHGGIPYFRDPRIHNLGDTALHASIARTATSIIDATAYRGEDVRSSLLGCIPTEMSVIDLCCGTGTSTRIPGVGIDTSAHMIREARWRRGRWSDFKVANAETYGETNEFDVATLFFALHEMPQEARRKVLTNAMRIAKHSVYVLDIATDSVFSDHMLRGEPYLLEYQTHILEDLKPFNPAVDLVVNGRILFAQLKCRPSSPTLLLGNSKTERVASDPAPQ